MATCSVDMKELEMNSVLKVRKKSRGTFEHGHSLFSNSHKTAAQNLI
jgi:hypothetical protein